jgi:hypothetical protein
MTASVLYRVKPRDSVAATFLRVPTAGRYVVSAPSVDLIDETFVVAAPARLAQWFADPALWRQWWPDLRLTVEADRGVEGIRWRVDGALVGSAEIWLEPWHDGVIVHWFVRAEPRRRGDGERIRREYATTFKRRIFALKDDLERGRPAGVPRS